jgi:hypothetical protein
MILWGKRRKKEKGLWVMTFKGRIDEENLMCWNNSGLGVKKDPCMLYSLINQ